MLDNFGLKIDAFMFVTIIDIFDYCFPFVKFYQTFQIKYAT